MNLEHLRALLAEVARGGTGVEAAVEQLRAWPFESLGFATVDHHRAVRCGHPEVIFCPGKTAEQVVAIARSLAARGSGVLATRASGEQRQALAREFLSAEVNEVGRAVWVASNGRQSAVGSRQFGGSGDERSSAAHCPPPTAHPPSPVTVVCAGTSDLPVAEEAAFTLRAMGAAVERVTDVGVSGLHRLLAHVGVLQRSCAVVAVAGMEGALPSVVGGLVACPVFAVPTSVGYGASMGGLAALLGMLNSCAANISVVNIDNGFGAGYSAGLVWQQVNGGARGPRTS